LFDPISVCRSLVSYTQDTPFDATNLFELNEVWNSWQHHSRYSNVDKNEALKRIGESKTDAHHFLKNAGWLIITLGSAFSYRLTDVARQSDVVPAQNGWEGVANCHRAPASWFTKHLLTIREITESIDLCLHQLFQFNPDIKIIFTISPVRHLRDGVIENNRSKARLIEAVHHMVDKFDRLYYFPAYELVIDVLRDYRFYDIDLAHPNYLATDFVLRKFVNACLDQETVQLVEEIKKIMLARKHKAFQPSTEAHRQFLKTSAARAEALQKKYPFLDLKEELEYFNSASGVHE
jgi:hypothetical protein